MNQHRITKSLPHCFGAFAILLCLALGGTGCRSLSEPGSASFASVIIKNHSAAEIATVTTQVFTAEGYRGGKSGTGEMVFEKEASRGTTLSREGLAATQQGARSLIRVRAEIVPLSEGQRLQCQAYIVTGGSDAFFSEEVRLTNVRRGPYQSLLNKVEKQLK